MSIDSIKVGSISYPIVPAPDATLDDTSYVSGDASSASSWTDVNVIAVSDTQATIFSKFTTMVKNIRFLYSKLGTTDFSGTGASTVTGALANLQNNKAPSVHDHTTDDLPISSNQIDSTAYIPTSSLVYSMNENLNNIQGKFTAGSNYTSNTTCGGINSGTEISSTDSLKSILKNMLYRSEPPAPPTEYESISIGTWSTAADVNSFFTTHTAWNGWAGLKLGNYVTINDGTYNTQWEIAGFNCEHNQTAADGTVYDNGYGICMIPKTTIATTVQWGQNRPMPYTESLINAISNSTVYNALYTILGSHIVQRDVLLGNLLEGSDPRKSTTSAYVWTKAYLTSMSVGQLIGTFAQYCNKYDDGEANYKLPVFDHENYYTGTSFWTRGVWGANGSGTKITYYGWRVSETGAITENRFTVQNGLRPLMYLR